MGRRPGSLGLATLGVLRHQTRQLEPEAIGAKSRGVGAGSEAESWEVIPSSALGDYIWSRPGAGADTSGTEPMLGQPRARHLRAASGSVNPWAGLGPKILEAGSGTSAKVSQRKEFRGQPLVPSPDGTVPMCNGRKV